MVGNLLTIDLRFENDIVLARQRSRQIAASLGFSHQDQTRISTAVSEIARNAFKYAGGGKVEFSIEGGPTSQALIMRVSDHGPGIKNLQDILAGLYTSETGMGMGIVGAKRLMDFFHIESEPGRGTRVAMGKQFSLPPHATPAQTIRRVSTELSRSRPETPLEEVQQQNRELLHTLDNLRERQAELARLNRELEDTNRGVVALYAELDDRADYLQRASDLKTRFISNMSHEFRTPLNAILSLSRLLLDRTDGPLSPEQEKQVTFVRKSAEDLSEIVNDLLDLAKVEAGKIVVRPRDFEVSNLFSALRGMLRPLLPGASVELVFDDPEGIPTMVTDDAKISQVLRNFISNALKFTERGHVRVSAAMTGDDRVLFAVEDTGIGIAPEDQHKIFEDWVQLENPMQKHVKGTGLGLPLSRKLAELLGGTVYVRSTPGVGSTFFAEIPVRFEGAQEASIIPEAIALDPQRKPVLIVEDNRETLMVYQKYLEGTQFQPISATTLAGARKAIRGGRPVAVLLDILLHDESAWAFLVELKSDPETRDIPVVVATLVDNEPKARALGADEFCIKPLERDWLLSRLERFTSPHARDKILVIDDDEVSRYLLKAVLASMPVEIVEADAGQQGLELARQLHPRVIFLDLMMPEMSGYEVLDRLKSDPVTADIPVIVNTSKTMDRSEREALEARVVTILDKQPGAHDAVLALVQSALSRAGFVAAGER